MSWITKVLVGATIVVVCAAILWSLDLLEATLLIIMIPITLLWGAKLIGDGAMEAALTVGKRTVADLKSRVNEKKEELLASNAEEKEAA